MNHVPKTETCLFCDAPGPVNYLRLCPRCHDRDTVRALYTRRKGWSPAWELHLRILAWRASQRLPLFESIDEVDLN